jgi:hypothetical protein
MEALATVFVGSGYSTIDLLHKLNAPYLLIAIKE